MELWRATSRHRGRSRWAWVEGEGEVGEVGGGLDGVWVVEFEREWGERERECERECERERKGLGWVVGMWCRQ